MTTGTNPAPRLAELVTLLDRAYDPATAESWDQVGLVSGALDQSVSRVLFAVDPSLEVIDEAITGQYDLLVTHHPLLLHGIHAVADTSAKGRAVRALVRNDVALYCAHTNADAARAGVNTALAAAVGMSDTQPIRPIPDATLSKITVFVPPDDVASVLEAMFASGAGQLGNYDSCAFRSEGQGQFRPTVGANPTVGQVGILEQVGETRLEVVVPRDLAPRVVAAMVSAHPYETAAYDVLSLVPMPGERGLGRWGRLSGRRTLADLAQHLADRIPHTHHGIRVAGDLEASVEAVAVCGGAGDSLLQDVRKLPVQAYVTSDLRHHPATDHLAEAGCALVDIAHFAGEWLWLADAARSLVADSAEHHWQVHGAVSELNTDPWSAHYTRST
ncbi:Nif3-like dinuclear metal center hexameric protein [Candidatus Nanopelagicales bacterium]|nr:Nif3-like dinuclear metal center hexameric protein [Candidatus Nanopelagicales bacterium]